MCVCSVYTLSLPLSAPSSQTLVCVPVYTLEAFMDMCEEATAHLYKELCSSLLSCTLPRET